MLQHNQQIIDHSKIKDAFFANMNHEIRTPMNGVIGMIDLLQKTSPSAETQKKYLNILKQSSNDMMTIINDILDFSKLEAGKLTIEYSTETLFNVLNQEIELFRAYALDKQNTIELEIDDNIPLHLELSVIRIKQVIGNLLSNAIKYTDKGKIIIRASLLESVDSSFKIKVEVIDNGIGIKEEDQRVLFNIFQQLDQESAKQAKGTGLGLSISRNLLNLMGGEIGVTSKLGEGSCFWFTFSAKETGVAKVLNLSNSDKEKRHKPENKILLVDDMEVNIFVAETMLVELGYTVDTANGGKEALQKFKKNDYQLILMDIQMPEMDGIETTKRIRSINRTIPPILALSANAMEGDREKYIASGFDDYLAKPIELDTLDQTLDSWLNPVHY